MGRAGSNRGQSLLEAALALPLTVFLMLGLVQLACLEHARLMTEYAAFQAARAGVVWNGSNERMRDAAFFALLPLAGDCSSAAALARTYQAAKAVDRMLADRGLGRTRGDVPEAFRRENLLGAVRVDTLSPALWPELGRLWKVTGGPEWAELDFDGADAFPPVPGADERFREVYRDGARDEAAEVHRSANALAIRVRYLYELRIPFANWILFTAWYAANAGRRLFGAIDRPSLRPGSMTGQSTGLAELGGEARRLTRAEGLDTLTPEEMETLWTLAMAGEGGRGRRYFLPLSASHRMRMQSSFYRKWLMHERPGWAP